LTAAGETVSIAEHMAAQNALQRFFNFGNDAAIHFDRHSLTVIAERNASIEDFVSRDKTQTLA